MNHLQEMCCPACREKIQQIERNAYRSDIDAQSVVKAFEDRRELLMMVEQLLMTVAELRQHFNTLDRLLTLPPKEQS